MEGQCVEDTYVVCNDRAQAWRWTKRLDILQDTGLIRVLLLNITLPIRAREADNL